MNELTYLPVTDRNGEHFELGLIINGDFTPLYPDHTSQAINGAFVEKLTEITSIKVSVDSGTATFRKENSKYWYAYKKLKGKLNKAYVGSSYDFTELNIVSTVERVNTPKTVTQNNDCVTDKPIIELAGKGKSDRHLEPSLITENKALEMARAEIKALKKENEVLLDRVCDVTDGYSKRWFEICKLEQRVKELENEANIQHSLIEALRQDVTNHRDEATKYHNELEQCQWEASRREEDVQGYYFMHEELSNQVFNFNVVLEKYRALADGKTRQAHPRFNKLLDFLEDIDKQGLSM